jgi:hypothetical protein
MNAPDLTLVSDDSIALADGFARRIGGFRETPTTSAGPSARRLQ